MFSYFNEIFVRKNHSQYINYSEKEKKELLGSLISLPETLFMDFQVRNSQEARSQPVLLFQRLELQLAR